MAHTSSANWHSFYMKKVKSMTDVELRWVIQDCNEAISALPNNPKNGVYMDEIHYCSMELSLRAKKEMAKAKKYRI